MQEDDRDGAQPCLRALADRRADARSRGVSIVPTVDALDASMTDEYRRSGQHDVAREDIGPALIADPQAVREPPRGHQQDRLAFALEQGVGRDGRADLHRVDALSRVERATECLAHPECRGRPRPAWSGDNTLRMCSSPAGESPMTSVNVPPRSIQNCQPGAHLFSIRAVILASRLHCLHYSRTHRVPTLDELLWKRP